MRHIVHSLSVHRNPGITLRRPSSRLALTRKHYHTPGRNDPVRPRNYGAVYSQDLSGNKKETDLHRKRRQINSNLGTPSASYA